MAIRPRRYMLAALSAFVMLPFAANAQTAFEVVAIPAVPTIELRDHQQIVNFDLFLSNPTDVPYTLVSLQLSVFDHTNRLVLKRELNQNGVPPAIDIVGSLLLPARGDTDLFQPFATVSDEVELYRMHFDLLLMPRGHPAPPVPLTADARASIDVLPHRPSDVTPFCLPTHGLTLVHDGHDLFSHHRRANRAAAFRQNPAMAVNPNLYAYDLMPTDDEGHLYRGDPRVVEGWLAYNQPVYAPADGDVVEVANAIPENTFHGTDVLNPKDADRIDPHGLGNHVILRHTDGRYSWLLHLRPGSVPVHTGDQVSAGQLLGHIGFSGDSLFPHLHYNVTAGATLPSQGVPSYFHAFVRHLGKAEILFADTGSGEIDTGDLIESLGTCLNPPQSEIY